MGNEISTPAAGGLENSINAGPGMPGTTGMLERRSKILNELVETEESYVGSLQACVRHFLEPIRRQRAEVLARKQLLSRGKPFLTGDEEKRVFSVLETILTLHESFLETLRDVQLGSNQMDIGRVFIDQVEFFKVYVPFINNYSDGLTTLTKKRENDAFDKFLCEAQFSTPGKADLASFLIMPVQRLPRYVMLLQELLKNTPSGDSDLNLLQTALERVQDVTHHINESKRDAENVHRITTISGLVSGYSDSSIKNAQSSFRNLLEPHRRLVDEGTAIWLKGWQGESGMATGNLVQKKKVTWYLLSDILLVCKSDPRNRAKLRVVLMTRLRQLDLIPLGEVGKESSWLSGFFRSDKEDLPPECVDTSDDDAIQITSIVSLGVSFVLDATPHFLSFPSQAERDAWVQNVACARDAALKKKVSEQEQEEELAWKRELERRAEADRERAVRQAEKQMRKQGKASEQSPLLGKAKRRKQTNRGCCSCFM